MSIIKHTIIRFSLTVATLAAMASCSKEITESKNSDNKLYLDAWLSMHYPNVKPTGLGVYITDDQPGTGEEISDKDYYFFLRYIATDLDGTIGSTSEEKVAQQLGTYSKSNYYGPAVVLNNTLATQVGILEMIKGMRVGGTRTAVIPGWLNVTLDGDEGYETGDDYLENETGTNVIYTITLTDKTEDIHKWEVDSLERYTARVMGDVDSTFYGYYYQQIKEPTDTTTLPRDTSFYINYTGRLLNGQVFDTTVEDTAKFYGIYSASKTYAPQKVTLKENHSEITLGGSTTSDGSTTIEGFAYCLSKMKAYEKGVCAFYSYLGYGYNGSGNAIPAYTPLSFEIEIVDQP